MRRLSFWLACTLLLISPALSGAAEWCGFDHIHRGLMDADPGYRSRVLEQRREIARLLRNRAVPRDTIYKIPVVVHILHLGEDVGVGSNITDEQVQSAITVLNEDFRKLTGTNGDGGGVDTAIEFCLAVRDEDDQPTNGINRVDAGDVGSREEETRYADYGLRTSDNGLPTQQEYDLKALSRWDNSRYYNIWVVTEIDDNEGEFNTMGFAYLPPTKPELDGMVVVHKAFGTVGTAAGKLSRTVTHEMGHAMGLYHTFEGDTEGLAGEITYEDLHCPSDQECGISGDCVDDTDPHIRSLDDCREDEPNECVSGRLLGEVVHNYMDYSGESCQNEFTAGQRDLMRTAIQSSRSTLLNSNGCVAVVKPVTDFSAPIRTCTGNIALKDQSTDGPTSWSWSFPGGSPETSAEQNPTVAYNTPGTYNVSLTASNSIGEGNTQTQTIVVYDAPVAACSVQTQNLSQDFGMGIYRVTFGDIDHASGDSIADGGYQDFSCTHMTVLDPGQEYGISIKVGISNYEDIRVYIDYDDNGNFSPWELAFESLAGRDVVTGTITTTQNPVTNKILRMRVISDFLSFTDPIDPCSDPEDGQAEDYGVIFQSADPTPQIQIGQPSSSITADGAVSYTVTYTDAEAVTLSTENITLNDTGNATATIAVTGTGTTSRTVTLSGISGDGTLGISIAEGTAANGDNLAPQTQSDTFIVDNTAPVIAISSPDDGATISDTTPTLTFELTEANPGTGTTTVKVDDVTANKNNGDALDQLANGSHTVAVSHTDAAGNTGSVSSTFTVDTTAPVMKGDIVKNGVIDLEDAITALKILADIPLDVSIEMAAEVDGNSAIDMKEAIFILQWVSGLRDN